MNIYTQKLPVCNSGQYICVTGLRNFFFALQDLIDRINSYFQRIALRKNMILIGFWDSTSQAFSDENKQPSLKWRCVNFYGEIMAESRQWISNIKISYSFKEGMILLCQSIRETGQISFTWFNTARKVSVLGVILVRIQSESGKMRTRITPNADTFYAVQLSLQSL